MMLNEQIGRELPFGTFLVCTHTMNNKQVPGKIEYDPNISERKFVSVCPIITKNQNWFISNWSAYRVVSEAEAVLFILENS